MMETLRMKKVFKVLWVFGAILLFISFFLDGYYYHICDLQGNLLGTWIYNPFTDWYISINNFPIFTAVFGPTLLEVPLYLTVLFMGIIFAAIYGILFKDIESEDELENLAPYSYLNFSLLGVSIFYIFIFPISYLFGNGYFVPVLQVADEIQEIIFIYSIGPGYIIQCSSFILLFPYTLFYYKTINSFYAKEHTPDKVIHRYIERNTQSIDFERMIQEEELKKEGYEGISIAKKLREQIYGGLNA